MKQVKEWIDGNESAKEMLSRVLTENPLLRLSPLNTLPLRIGNVLELLGPSPSAKTHILIQVAIDCILPKEWNGVEYGGLGRAVMFIDLDSRFDILRLSQMLKNRIFEAIGNCKKDDDNLVTCCDNELFALCMRRFLYIRCYDSLEFLATLKRLHVRLQKESEAQETRVHFLMIDSIGAFHWVDRLSSSLHLRANNRKGVSLHNVSAAVVSEIKKLMILHPLLVIATKATILGNRYSGNDVKWLSPDRSKYFDFPFMLKLFFTNTTTFVVLKAHLFIWGGFHFLTFGWLFTDTFIFRDKNRKRLYSPDRSVSKYADKKLRYREYMPLVWQSFVTHRILVQATDDLVSVGEHYNQSIYSLEYLLPPLPHVDQFAVNELGVYCIS